MVIRDYAQTLRRSWPIVMALVIFGVIGACGVSLLQKPVYEATSKAFVSTNDASTLADLTQGSTFTQQEVTSYAEVATTPYVLSRVISDLHLKQTLAELSKNVTASASTDTVVIDITASNGDPRLAARIANAVTERLAQAVLQLTPDTSGDRPTVKITQVQQAAPPTEPTTPNLPLTITGGILLGLAFGIATAFIRSALDTRIRTVEALQSASQAPLLGEIAWDSMARQLPLITGNASVGTRAESYRSLRTNLQFTGMADDRRPITVTSAIPSEGKSTTAANLAITLADAGESVLLIDGDLRRPKLASYFGVDGTVGLTDVLIERAPINDAIQRWGEKSLSLLPAGTLPPNPSELLQSIRFQSLLTELCAEYDIIIIDAPPLLPVSDAAILAKESRGALLIVSVRHIHTMQLRAAIGALHTIDARILGLVATMANPKTRRQYRYEDYGYLGTTTSTQA